MIEERKGIKMAMLAVVAQSPVVVTSKCGIARITLADLQKMGFKVEHECMRGHQLRVEHQGVNFGHFQVTDDRKEGTRYADVNFGGKLIRIGGHDLASVRVIVSENCQ